MINKYQPKRNFPDYKSSIIRSPREEPLMIKLTNSEITGPMFKKEILNNSDNDLTINFSKNSEKPLGQEIFVHGFVKDENGNGLKDILIEIWQANAGGKYRHRNDTNEVSLDKNFGGCGRFITSLDGYYIFKTIEPGAYPYPNRGIEWRPKHIHFSIFGSMFLQRLVTQMYFEGDPLIKFCPMVNSIPDVKARKLLIGKLDLSKTENEKILGYRFDIILRGKDQSYFENKIEGL
tara:strand:+ start:1351 stop:2052 length:702 start_codon:yes stop_codon:yes gene_type:complete